MSKKLKKVKVIDYIKYNTGDVDRVISPGTLMNILEDNSDHEIPYKVLIRHDNVLITVYEKDFDKLVLCDNTHSNCISNF
jgi:hypothetical protein